MKSDKLLAIIGEAKEAYVLSALDSRNGKKKPHRQYSFSRIVLIAAMIALLLFLVGCGAYIIVRNLYWSEELQEDLAAYNEISDLGIVSKNWIIDEAAIELSAEPPIDGIVTITCKEWGHNAEGALVVGSEYWIEKWNGTTYEEIPTRDRTPWIVSEQEVACGTESSWTVNYLEKYGELVAGEYRIGMMFSKESPDGEIAQLGCYAKFNVQEAAYAPTLEAFTASLNNILNAKSYHIIRYSYDLPYFSPFSAVRTEILKFGDNYAECNIRKSKDSDEWTTEGDGRLYRNGVGYDIEWSEDSVNTIPTAWSEADYVTAEVPLWSIFFDSAYQDAIDVTIADNQLRIIALTGVKMDKFYEMRIFFAGDGSIYRMECAGIPDKTYAEEDRELWSVVEILTTSPEDAELLLQSIDLTIPQPFSHSDDLQLIEQQGLEKRLDGFRNQSVQDEMTSAIAAQLARAEVSVELATVTVFFDQAENIWKVEITSALDDSLFYAIYINGDGITQMIVTMPFQ